MALGTTGITTSAVATILGSSSRDVGTLCKHSAINKWAKGKPVAYAQSAGLTDADRRLADQGFNLDNATDVDINALFTRAASNSDWVYTPPSGGASSPYRLGDFRGYNPNAETLYSYTIPTTIETYSNTATASFKITKNSNAELSLSDFIHFENYLDFSSWRYAIAYKKSGWDYAKFAYGASVTTTSNEIYIDVTFPEMGTYTVLPIITRETEETTNVLDSTYLPSGLKTVTVSRQYAVATVTISNESSISPMFSYDNNLYMFGNMINLSVVNNKTDVGLSSTTGMLVFRIECYDNYDNYMGEFTFRDYTNGQFIYSGTGTKSYTLDYNSGTPIYLPNYIDNVDNVSKLVIYADVEKVNGTGVFSIAKMYKWEVYKS